jgi:hypothetical protein
MKFRLLKTILIATAAVCQLPMLISLSWASPIEIASGSTDPLALYGGAIRFAIERNGELVGEHVVSFQRVHDGLAVESRTDIAVKLWFVSAYRFQYLAREIWRDGELHWLSATSDQNGSLNKVRAVREGDRLRISSRSGSYSAPVIPPTTHWNSMQLHSGVLLNTLTGNLNRVTVRSLGSESVVAGKGTVAARRFAVSGDLNVDVWYDHSGRWVKLRFAAEDGSIIDYVCRSCGPEADLSRAN